LPIQSPWVAIMNRQTEIARKLAAELALPPAQRSRAAMTLQDTVPRRLGLLIRWQARRSITSWTWTKRPAHGCQA
jgi:hypothetical protein